MFQCDSHYRCCACTAAILKCYGLVVQPLGGGTVTTLEGKLPGGGGGKGTYLSHQHFRFLQSILNDTLSIRNSEIAQVKVVDQQTSRKSDTQKFPLPCFQHWCFDFHGLWLQKIVWICACVVCHEHVVPVLQVGAWWVWEQSKTGAFKIFTPTPPDDHIWYMFFLSVYFFSALCF